MSVNLKIIVWHTIFKICIFFSPPSPSLYIYIRLFIYIYILRLLKIHSSLTGALYNYLCLILTYTVWWPVHSFHIGEDLCCCSNCVSSSLRLTSSAGRRGADCGVTELRHGRRRCYNVFLVVPQPTTTAAVTRAGAAWECGDNSFAETRVHEAVDDWIDAGRGVRQQVNERDRGSCESTVGRGFIKSSPCVDTVKRHPAEKEENHDNHQHTDDSLFSLKFGLRSVAS